MSSSVHPAEQARRPAARPAWSLLLAAAPCGLSLAREGGWLLAWDTRNSLYLVNRAGELQGRTTLPGKLVAACAADDGSACAAVGAGGEVWRLTPDLMPRWTARLPSRATACALDPFGRYLATADAGGGLRFFNAHGKLVGRTQTPRPLVHLAFVPEESLLVGCADYGFVACFAPDGECKWRDGLVAHVGTLAVSGDGSRIVLACFSDGLRGYDLEGKQQPRLRVTEPCRLVALSFNGRRTLVGTLGSEVCLVDREGQSGWKREMDTMPAAIALGALGEVFFAALGDGHVTAVPLP
jgi:hypothetical protein